MAHTWQFKDPTFPRRHRPPRPRDIEKEYQQVLPPLPDDDESEESPEEEEPAVTRRRLAMLEKRSGPSGGTSIFLSADEEEAGILPTNLDVALKDTVSLLHVEEWLTHPDDESSYDSKLLQCESRLRKITRLSRKLKPPNACVTAVVCDLLRDTYGTLPPILRRVCAGLMKYIEESIYSNEQHGHTDLDQLKTKVSERMEKAPWFVVARSQQDSLEAMENQVALMQRIVDEHLSRRKSVLHFIIRMQKSERVELQRWLFHYWRLTASQKRERIDKLSRIMQSSPSCSPSCTFMMWRMYVSQARLARAKNKCNLINVESGVITNRITQIELENEASQLQLAETIKKAQAVKEDCLKAESEAHRLQQLWEATQPELLLTVLIELLGVFFKLLVQTARFSGVEMRQRLAGTDVSTLVAGLPWRRSTKYPFTPCLEASDEDILLRWVNLCMAKARAAADTSLAQEPGPTTTERVWLEIVQQQQDCTNLGVDLSNSVVFCAVFALLKAADDDKPMCASDLWPLEERDLATRATSFFSLLGAFAPDLRTKCLLAPADIVEANTRLTVCLLAEAFLKQPLLPKTDLPSLPSASSDGPQFLVCKKDLEVIISKMEICARTAEREALEDPSPMLHGGEDFHALATLTAEQVLLRWVNTLIFKTHGKLVENFGSDLQDGIALSCLLQTIAPEVAPASWSDQLYDRLEQVASMAYRCTDFELLTPEAISESHADVLAVFLAQLFLKHSRLGPRPGSLMCMHLTLLEKTCTESYTILATPDDTNRVMEFCTQLSQQWDQILLALSAVKEATRATHDLRSNLRSFSGDTLAQRAYGRPRAMLDTKEKRELDMYATLTKQRVDALTKAGDVTAVNRIQDILRKQFRLLRDVFKHYAQSSSGISLEGLLKLHRECKLRSADLAPHHLEVIFYDFVDAPRARSTAETTLSPQMFVEVLLEFASIRYRNVIDSLPDQLSHLIDNHLKPYACQETESVFQRMAYDLRVREVLDKHSKELKIIFQVYATADISSGDAMQKVNTMNIKEFRLLLDHCEFRDETLTESAVQQIFEGIQQSGDSSDDESEGGNADAGSAGFTRQETPEKEANDAGIDDDDELAFSEFLDGLVAVAAYKHPDPFTPFFVRVNSFIINLFSALRRHWSRKRLSPQVDAMLNVLQKKLRGAQDVADAVAYPHSVHLLHSNTGAHLEVG